MRIQPVVFVPFRANRLAYVLWQLSMLFLLYAISVPAVLIVLVGLLQFQGAWVFYVALGACPAFYVWVFVSSRVGRRRG